MNCNLLKVGLAFGLCAAWSVAVIGQDSWPQFRGADARGIAPSADLPDRWGPEENVAWKRPIEGVGWSSPIIANGRVFVTACVSEGEVEPPKKGLYFGGERPAPEDTHHWRVICLALADGAVLWETTTHSGAPPGPKHLKNSYASETPATDGERVYALFGNVGLFCLDFDGELVWEKRLSERRMRNGWGTSASPVLHGDRVYVARDTEDDSFVAAFDKLTGEEVWRVARDEPSNFSTPFIWENELRTELVTTGVRRTRSYDLNGTLLWEFEGMSSIVIPTPFAAHGLLYVCAGYVGDNRRPNKPIYAVKPGAAGDISLPPGEESSEFIVWRATNAAPYNPSPLVYKDKLYVLWDFGFLSCRNALTGEEIYEKQRINPRGTASFTASPWASDGKIYCLSEEGDAYVFRAGDRYELLHVNSLDEMCMATPAIADDTLVIRTLSKLWAIRRAP